MPILDCRDTRICLWQDSGATHSPGFVLLDGQEYQFGQAAREQSRVRPRDSSSRFWWQLSTQPLKPGLGTARHTADLVHAHLRYVLEAAGGPEQLALAVPDSMPREQLSLLLGIAQACEVTVAGLVSRSALMGSNSPLLASSTRFLHLEAQLNQTIVNELVVDGDRISLARSTPLPACGLLALQERCVSAIASAFVQQTRFDPRRSASSEQLLYNQLPGILSTLEERGEVSVDIDGHRCRVNSAAFANVSEKLLAGVAQARAADELPLLIDPELQQLPGMSALTGMVATLDEDALWHAWEKQHAHVQDVGKDNHLIDRLPTLHHNGSAAIVSNGNDAARQPAMRSPAAAVDASKQAGQQARQHASATHILIHTQALPLRGEEIILGEGFCLRASNGHWTLHGDGGLINGLPSTSQQPLHLGDTLSLGTAGHGRLIEVLD
ncbi:MAG: hypothetical protein AB8B57_14500 [Congregibacter sp.]